MDTTTLTSATDPVPWYQSPRIGRGIAITQSAILAWIGGAVFEIAVAMAVKEFGLFPKGAPKTPLGMLMGGFVVLAVTLGSLFVGTRLAESVPPINGVEAGVLDYETLGVSAALASQEHFNLSEFVVGFTPSAAVKGNRQLRKSKKQERGVGAPNPFAGPPPMMHPRGPPPAMQTNPSAIAAAPPQQAPSAPAQSPHPPPSPLAGPSPSADASSTFGVPLSAAYGF
jgi:hypothetical protein